MPTLLLACGPVMGQFTSFSTVANNAYATGDINSCAFQVNNLTTVGNYQFVAYYDTSRRIMIGRREQGSSAWQTFYSGYTISSSEVTDSHNVIAMAVDSAGYMHLSWNMHNVSLNYATTTAPVTGATLGTPTFLKRTAANAPTLFAAGGATTNSVTYPQFYNIPGSNELLFTYRNGGAGGGSGNGDQYFDVYSPATQTWTNTRVINGQQTSVNGYINHLAYTPTGDMMMSWTWRATPNWQTNSNIMFARSPDNGSTWTRYDGTPYTLPIVQSGAPASSVGEVVKAIPQGMSLINQTSMAVGANDRPLIATYWTPGWDAAAGTGDPNRQYMLVYHDGNAWRTSQITNRTSETSIDTSGSRVRDLGRPVVLTDDAGRVLVITRSEDSASGGHSNPSTPGNNVVVYHTTVENLASATPAAWDSVALDSANMGAWEPTYDVNLWNTQRKLSLFYQPMGLSGQSSATLRVLDWDAAGYFATLKASSWNAPAGGAWESATNWSSGVPDGVSAVAKFASGGGVVTLGGSKVLGGMTFSAAAGMGYTISGGSLSLDNGPAALSTISVTAGSHTVATPLVIGTSAGVQVSVAGGSTLTLAGGVSGTGGIIKSGGGTLVLAAVNSYGGMTVVNEGTLRIQGSGLSPNTNMVLNGGMLEGSGTITRTLGTGPGQIQITGGGISAADGSTFTLAIGSPTGSVVWGSTSFSPATLVLGRPGDTGSVTLAANLNLGSARRNVQANGGLATLSGTISGTGSLGVNPTPGGGILVLSNGGNTYSGGTVINPSTGPGGRGTATVRAAASGAMGTGAIDIGPEGNETEARLELVGGITLPNAVTFRGRTNGSVAIRNVGGDNTLSGVVTLNVGGSNYWVESGAGSLTLAGTMTSAASGSRVVNFVGDGDGVISGGIQNGGATIGITKGGRGTWVLSGNNTYTGVTTVLEGDLFVRGGMAWGPVLSGAGGGDVRGGRLTFDYAGATTPRSAVVGALRSGQVRNTAASGDWTLGWFDDGESELVIMPAVYGDLNLDGGIDGDDYALIDRGMAMGLSGWAAGDVDYSGSITSADYLLVDGAYGRQNGVLSPAMLAEREARFGAAYVAELLAAVPEPGVAGVVVAAGLLAGRRARRV